MTPIAYNQSYFDGGTEPHPAGYTDYERNTNKVYVGELLLEETQAFHHKIYAHFQSKLEGKDVLEVGSAKGFLIEDFSTFGVGSIFGVDVSSYAVGQSSVSALITIGDALSVLQTYDDNQFDTLIGVRFLPCLPDPQLSEFLAQAVRVSNDQIFIVDAEESYPTVDVVDALSGYYNIKTEQQWLDLVPSSSTVKFINLQSEVEF